MLLKLLRSLLPSIAQILLGFVLIPIIAGLLGLFSENGGVDDLVSFVATLVSETPVLGTITDALVLCVSNGGSEQSRAQFIASLESMSSADVVAVCSIGMWSGICFKLGKLLGIKGLPVLQSLVAVVLSSAFTNFVSAYADPLFLLLLPCFTITLNLVLTILVADRKILAVLCGILCEGTAAVFATAYVALLIMAMQGLIPSLGIWLLIQLCLIIPMSLFLVVDLLLV